MKEETIINKKINKACVDDKNRLRLSSILLFSQEAAIEAVETDLGITRDKTQGRGLLWVLARYRIEIDRLPALGEEIRILSWQSKMIAFFFVRNFEILDKDGNPIVKGVTYWAMINEKERQIITPSDYGIIIPNHIRGDELPRPEKIIIDPGDQKTIIHCNEEDLDSNNHMNNVVYMDKCLSLIPKGYLNTHNIETIDINYKKELRLNEETELRYKIGDDVCSFDSEAFSLVLHFKEAL